MKNTLPAPLLIEGLNRAFKKGFKGVMKNAPPTPLLIEGQILNSQRRLTCSRKK
jgi:hypothetical protein